MFYVRNIMDWRGWEGEREYLMTQHFPAEDVGTEEDEKRSRFGETVCTV